MERVSLRLSEYQVRIRFVRGGRLSSHIGVTLRGGFGAALRHIACVQSQQVSCSQCILQGSCPYGYMFETPVAEGQAVMKLYTHAPHPFVIRSPLDVSPRVAEGTEVDLGVVLMGRAHGYFPYVLLALQHLGERGLGAERVPFRVERVVAGTNGRVVYPAEAGRPVPLVTPETVQASLRPPRECALMVHFLTPLRLRVENRVLTQPDFGALVSASLRRLELLTRVHDAGRFELNAAEIARAARQVQVASDRTRWHDVVRYSRRQEREMPLGGLVGEAVFVGEVGSLVEILSLAGRVHVGKGTAFGHGHFRVEEVSDGPTS